LRTEHREDTDKLVGYWIAEFHNNLTRAKSRQEFMKLMDWMFVEAVKELQATPG